MIIIGHKAIQSPQFKKIKAIADIACSNAYETMLFHVKDDIGFSISKHCFDNEVKYAIQVATITHALIYSKLGASYIIYNSKDIAYSAQKIADEYFFDSKIICVICNENELESIASLGIDGAIFSYVLENVLM